MRIEFSFFGVSTDFWFVDLPGLDWYGTLDALHETLKELGLLQGFTLETFRERCSLDMILNKRVLPSSEVVEVWPDAPRPEPLECVASNGKSVH